VECGSVHLVKKSLEKEKTKTLKRENKAVGFFLSSFLCVALKGYRRILLLSLSKCDAWWRALFTLLMLPKLPMLVHTAAPPRYPLYPPLEAKKQKAATRSCCTDLDQKQPC
jgi:hypothetical protein